MSKKTIINVITVSLVQAISAGVFVWLWLMFMMNLESLFNVTAQPSSSSFIVIPLMFIIVAVLSAGSVLGYPLYLLFQKNWTKAIVLVLLTLLWLGIFSGVLIYIF